MTNFKYLDDKLFVKILYTDFVKAFDVVPVRKLLHKLKNYG